ncbi:MULTISPECIES: YgiW/YdeI family stress tolerance OB fold protein [Shewanella]|uniref:YgiW/YdeI family stress tolerance OB fold protein n=1 Tax=Shewanella TaxID=22 RepID=UPI001BC59FC0|nr:MULTISPECIES: NirD/YgiW/YdeI family stress tolerance protein [Shewanella]GIU50837.1 hypothetical protein TUM4249_13080 [Shewanella sp. KT0246]
MKKILVCGVLFASTTAIASQPEAYTDTALIKPAVKQAGGFTGPSRGEVYTAANALEAKDDTPAVLTGYIVESLGDEEYRFKDESGEIIVEIDNDDWRGISATPDTKLTLLGEIDTEWTSTSMDVDVVSLAD